MKKPLLTIFILSLLFSVANAQGFQSVNSGRVAYFSLDDKFNFLKIDSLKTTNGDSVFYPSRNLEYVDYRCYSRFAPSWAGSKIIIRNDGTNIYFNHNNDSIIIKTKAGLNEKWIAFQIADSISIMAEVIGCKYDSLLGLEDSIKTIRFQSLDSAGKPIDDLVNQIQLLLSQHYGWKEALNFNLFPNLEAECFPYQYFQPCELIGLSNPKMGRQNLTWFEVYNFEPGDVLHVYETHFNCCGIFPCKMLHRQILYTYLDRTNFPDSIVYHVKCETHELITQYPDTVSTKVFFDTIREVIKPYPEFDMLSNELILSEDGSRISLLNQFKYLGLECKSFSESFTNYENDSCWRLFMYYGGGPSDYIKGLGGGYYDYNEICSVSLRELQYYKKGNNEWGTPFNFTGIETLRAYNEMKVFPNPTSETIFIETNGQTNPITFELYSAGGSNVIKEDLPGGNQQIDVRRLKPGLYFYTITDDKRHRSPGKVIITR
jgi:hypothetical protein